MKQKSLIEDILDTAIKSPVAGIVISVIFAVLGLYLSNKQAPAGAKPSEMMFLPMMHMFGKVSYMLAVLVLVVAGIGYIVTSSKKKNQKAFFGTRRTLDDLKNLSWKEFEEYVGSMFEKMRYTVEVPGD